MFSPLPKLHLVGGLEISEFGAGGQGEDLNSNRIRKQKCCPNLFRIWNHLAGSWWAQGRDPFLAILVLPIENSQYRTLYLVDLKYFQNWICQSVSVSLGILTRQLHTLCLNSSTLGTFPVRSLTLSYPCLLHQRYMIYKAAHFFISHLKYK